MGVEYIVITKRRPKIHRGYNNFVLKINGEKWFFASTNLLEYYHFMIVNESIMERTSSVDSEYISVHNVLVSGDCYVQEKGAFNYILNLWPERSPVSSIREIVESLNNDPTVLLEKYNKYYWSRTMKDLNSMWIYVLNVIKKTRHNQNTITILLNNFNCGTNKLAKKMLDVMVSKLDPKNYDKNVRIVLDRYFQVSDIRNDIISFADGIGAKKKYMYPNEEELVDEKIFYDENGELEAMMKSNIVANYSESRKKLILFMENVHSLTMYDNVCQLLQTSKCVGDGCFGSVHFISINGMQVAVKTGSVYYGEVDLMRKLSVLVVKQQCAFFPLLLASGNCEECDDPRDMKSCENTVVNAKYITEKSYDRDNVFVVMEAGDMTLIQFANSQTIHDIVVWKKIFREILFGIFMMSKYAGVYHRDLHSNNIMLREDGSVMIIDFGEVFSEVYDPLGKTYNWVDSYPNIDAKNNIDIYNLIMSMTNVITARIKKNPRPEGFYGLDVELMGLLD